jgi:hypothetical protein
MRTSILTTQATLLPALPTRVTRQPLLHTVIPSILMGIMTIITSSRTHPLADRNIVNPSPRFTILCPKYTALMHLLMLPPPVALHLQALQLRLVVVHITVVVKSVLRLFVPASLVV